MLPPPPWMLPGAASTPLYPLVMPLPVLCPKSSQLHSLLWVANPIPSKALTFFLSPRPFQVGVTSRCGPFSSVCSSSLLGPMWFLPWSSLFSGSPAGLAYTLPWGDMPSNWSLRLEWMLPVGCLLSDSIPGFATLLPLNIHLSNTILEFKMQPAFKYFPFLCLLLSYFQVDMAWLLFHW